MISPLVPKNADLRSYTWLKLDYARLFASEFFAMANDAEFRAAFILWCKSMQQIPAGSLPNNDKALAGWCGKSLKQWAKIKDMALHGWQEADDGRLYHPVLAEVVNDILFKTDAKATSNDQDDKETKKAMTNAERQAAHKARQKEKELALLAEKSNATGNGTSNEEVTLGNGNSNGLGNESNATGNGQVTASNGNFVTSEGGKGGDLDLNLEKDLDLKTLNTSEDKSSGKTPETPSQAHDPVVTKDPFTTTARQVLWTVGVPLLQEFGQTEKAARQFLGQMVKLYGEDQVADAVTSARTTKPLDATAYIGGYLKNQSKQKIKQDTQARGQTSHTPDNNSTEWMTPELEAKLNERFAA